MAERATTRPTALPERSMPQYRSLQQKVAARTGVQLNLPSDALFLGSDGSGGSHYWSRIAGTVVVVRNGRIERRQDLDGRQLAEWINYVGAERGWEELRYVDSFGEHIAKAFGVE